MKIIDKSMLCGESVFFDFSEIGHDSQVLVGESSDSRCLFDFMKLKGWSMSNLPDGDYLTVKVVKKIMEGYTAVDPDDFLTELTKRLQDNVSYAPEPIEEEIEEVIEEDSIIEEVVEEVPEEPEIEPFEESFEEPFDEPLKEPVEIESPKIDTKEITQIIRNECSDLSKNIEDKIDKNLTELNKQALDNIERYQEIRSSLESIQQTLQDVYSSSVKENFEDSTVELSNEKMILYFNLLDKLDGKVLAKALKNTIQKSLALGNNKGVEDFLTLFFKEV